MLSDDFCAICKRESESQEDASKLLEFAVPGASDATALRGGHGERYGFTADMPRG